MLAAVEILLSAFLFWYSLHSFQNYPLTGWFLIAGTSLWGAVILIWRSRMLGSSLLFHFAVITAYFLRAVLADGPLWHWYFAIGISQWIVVLILCARGKSPADVSVFLSVTMMCPLYFFILNARDDSGPGILLWLLPVFHASLAHFKRSDPLKFPVSFILFFFLILFSVPFSLYPHRNVQFLWVNLGCVLLYFLCAREDTRTAILYAALQVSCVLILFGWRNTVALLPAVAYAFGTRLTLGMFHNELVPFLLMLTILLLFFLREIRHRLLIYGMFLTVISLGFLVFLTYSRVGATAYLLFWIVFAARKSAKKELRKRIVLIAGLSMVGLLILLALKPVRTLVAWRLQESSSVQMRLLSVQTGVKTVLKHPITGTGWLNFYAHAGNSNREKPLSRLRDAQQVLHGQSHSFAIDMAEACGIPFALVCFSILLAHYKKVRGVPLWGAALPAIAFHSMFDSALIWISNYSLLWIVLGFAATFGERKGIALKSSYIRPLAICGIAACTLALASDHLLLASSFHHRNNQDKIAIREANLAGLFSPLDALPIEKLKEIRKAAGDTAGTVATLEKLSGLKKDFAPYLAQLGRLKRSSIYLEQATKLDPYNVLSEPIFLDLAEISDRKTASFQLFLNLHFLNKPHARDVREHLLLQAINEEQFITGAMRFARDNTTSANDCFAAVKNLVENLISMRRHQTAIRSLEAAFQMNPEFSYEQIDFLTSLLAGLYYKVNEKEKIENLIPISNPGFLVRTWSALAANRFAESEEQLILAENYYGFPECIEAAEYLYKEWGEYDRLRRYFRICFKLQSWVTDPVWLRKEAQSYLDERNWKGASSGYSRLILADYNNPESHWWNARMAWITGNPARAQQANAQLQRLIPSNWFVENLYRSSFFSPVWYVLITQVFQENKIGGREWRTGIYEHPPSTIVFPQNRRFYRIEGEAALIHNAWAERTDGVEFIIRSPRESSFRLNPREIPVQRKWVPFEWRSSTGPRPIVLQTRYLENADYDWAMWVINKAE